ncbi:unnamed protein product [Parajaminaea phylloscopi]
MRFHILGLGSVGNFLAHHVRQSLRPGVRGALHSAGLAPSNKEWVPYLAPDLSSISVTLQVRSQGRAAGFAGTFVEHAGVRNFEPADGYRIEASGIGKVVPDSLAANTYDDADLLTPSSSSPASVVQQLGFTDRPDAIDSLLVTTKADSTLAALRPLVPRLTPASTVVLLQNGMGILDELNEQLWPEEGSRPRFVLGNVTHGCWSKGPFETVHAGLGSIILGIPPSTLGNRGIVEAASETTAPPSISLDSRVDSPCPPPDLLAQSPLHLSLLYTLSTLLTIPALDTKLEPTYQAYLVRALQKLAVNACVNPLTAILDCRNGDLLGDQWAQDVWNDVLHEASSVFFALASSQGEIPGPAARLTSLSGRRRATMEDWSHLIQRPLTASSSAVGSPTDDTRPVLDPALTPPALLQLVRAVTKATSSNYSSMHRDIRFPSADFDRQGRPSYGKQLRGKVKPRTSTEVRYLNGWLSQRGRELGVRTDVNDTLVRLIESLGAANERRLYRAPLRRM